jgi:soluble lytic murein transglycosylase-like protein
MATDAGLAPSASYASDFSTSAEFGASLPESVSLLPMPSGRAEADVAYAAPADFAANSFVGPQPSGAMAPAPMAPAAEPVALMSRTRPLAVVEGGGDDVNRLIDKYAELYEVPVQLVRRVVKRESNFYPGAYNHGHWGLMQIKHATARGMGYDGAARGLLDAETNLKFAVKYLRGAWMVAKGNPDLAVRFYARGYYYDAKRMNLLDETGLGRDRVRRRRA